MRILFLFILVSLGAVALTYSIAIIKSDLDRYVAESECVEKKITLGIERSDIRTGSGTCWVEDGALNKPLN